MYMKQQLLSTLNLKETDKVIKNEMNCDLLNNTLKVTPSWVILCL